jgi:hypothetical protein
MARFEQETSRIQSKNITFGEMILRFSIAILDGGSDLIHKRARAFVVSTVTRLPAG